MKQEGTNPLSQAFRELADDSQRISKANIKAPTPPLNFKNGRKRAGLLPEELRKIWLLWIEYRDLKAANEIRKMVESEKKRTIIETLQLQLEPQLGKCSRDDIMALCVDDSWMIWRKKSRRGNPHV